MALSYSTAKWVAPLSFVFDFAAQQYGLFAKPNMQDINDRNLSFFSPQPYFIGAFFFPQQLLQLAWLYRLWKLNPRKSEVERKELDQIVDFVPYYAVGNVCIAGGLFPSTFSSTPGKVVIDRCIVWMVFWNSERLDISNVFVAINTLTQLYYMVAKLPPMNTKSTSSVLTHIVSKTFAGIGVLDLLHNTSAAFFKDQAAPLAVKVLTGLGFGLASAGSDWIFGGCLVYDLVALAVGQSGSWRMLLGGYAAASAVIVGAKNLAM